MQNIHIHTHLGFVYYQQLLQCSLVPQTEQDNVMSQIAWENMILFFAFNSDSVYVCPVWVSGPMCVIIVE